MNAEIRYTVGTSGENVWVSFQKEQDVEIKLTIDSYQARDLGIKLIQEACIVEALWLSLGLEITPRANEQWERLPAQAMERLDAAVEATKKIAEQKERIDELETKLSALEDWADDYLYSGRSVNASDEQLIRDELAREVLSIIEDEE